MYIVFLIIVKLKNNNIKHPKFSQAKGDEFSKSLRRKVNKYFRTKNISKNANNSMVIKTAIMLTIFLLPFIILNSGVVNSSLVLFLLYITSGIGMAGIGMAVGHDAIHGSYSKNQKINKLISYSFNLIGANATVWKIQHNVLHHTYPNIEHADDDINVPIFLRFSPNAKKYWIHKFQHIYIWFFYSLSTLSWVTAKDFIRINRYHKMGFLVKKNEFRNAVLSIIAWKILYYSFALILPIIMVELPWWHVLLAFITLHLFTGLFISLVFQVAHITPSSKFPMPDDNGLIAGDWSTHQFATTANYSPKSKYFSWFIGGLNYQIEHHLLPLVCHVHYKELSKIVIKTAKEYGMPYSSNKTFFKAIQAHYKMIYKLGHEPFIK